MGVFAASNGCCTAHRGRALGTLADARAGQAMFPKAPGVRPKKLCTEDPFGAVDRPAFGAKRANQWPTDSQNRLQPLRPTGRSVPFERASRAPLDRYRAVRDEPCSGATLKLCGFSPLCQIFHIVA
jgi:hypothetical protein